MFLFLLNYIFFAINRKNLRQSEGKTLERGVSKIAQQYLRLLAPKKYFLRRKQQSEKKKISTKTQFQTALLHESIKEERSSFVFLISQQNKLTNLDLWQR